MNLDRCFAVTHAIRNFRPERGLARGSASDLGEFANLADCALDTRIGTVYIVMRHGRTRTIVVATCALAPVSATPLDYPFGGNVDCWW
jgi:hypothetical protein